MTKRYDYQGTSCQNHIQEKVWGEKKSFETGPCYLSIHNQWYWQTAERVGSAGIMLKYGDQNTNLKQLKALAKLCPLSSSLWCLNQQLFFDEDIALTNRVPFFHFPFVISDWIV